MKIKKIVRFLLVFCLITAVFLMSGCGKTTENNNTTGENNNQNNTENPDNTETPNNTETPGNENNQTTTAPDLDAIYAAVSTAYGTDFHATEAKDAAYLTSELGVNSADVEDFFCNVSADTAYPDIFVGIKATDETKATAIAQQLETYRASVAGDPNLTPENAAKINSSKVIRQGQYVFLVLLGKTDTSITDETERSTFAATQTKIAEDKINEFFNTANPS